MKIDIIASSDIAPDLKKRVEEILSIEQLARYLPRSKSVSIRVEKALPSGVSLVAAHSNWSPSYFSRVACFSPFLCQDRNAVTPPGLVRVVVECVLITTGGMSSYYGFIGYSSAFWCRSHRDVSGMPDLKRQGEQLFTMYPIPDPSDEHSSEKI